MWFSNGINRSAGVVILKGQILHGEKDVSGRLIISLCELEQKQFVMVNIYATNDTIRNRKCGGWNLSTFQKFSETKV